MIPAPVIASDYVPEEEGIGYIYGRFDFVPPEGDLLMIYLGDRAAWVALGVDFGELPPL